MATDAREARRRKIMARGSDRLALITGQKTSLPSSTSTSHHSHSLSTPPLLFQDQAALQTLISDPNNGNPCGEGDVSGSSLLKHYDGNKSERSAAINTGTRAESQLLKCETGIGTTRTSSLDIGSEVQPSLVPLTVQTPSNFKVDTTVQTPSNSKVDSEPLAEPQTRYSRTSTANQITSSISASENTRVRSSVILAFLVVLSLIGFPLVSSKIMQSIIASRPLYLVLLTSVTIVLAPILLEKRSSEKADDGARTAPSEEGNEWVEGLGKALEIGLVLHKAFSAAFMDCSVYAVVVICGLTLLQRWL